MWIHLINFNFFFFHGSVFQITDGVQANCDVYTRMFWMGMSWEESLHSQSVLTCKLVRSYSKNKTQKKNILAFYIITCNKLFLHVGHLLIAFCVFTYKRNRNIYINIYSLPDCSNLHLSSWFTVGVWITARFITIQNLYREEEEVSDWTWVYISTL